MADKVVPCIINSLIPNFFVLTLLFAPWSNILPLRFEEWFLLFALSALICSAILFFLAENPPIPVHKKTIGKIPVFKHIFKSTKLISALFSRKTSFFPETLPCVFTPAIMAPASRFTLLAPINGAKIFKAQLDVCFSSAIPAICGSREIKKIPLNPGKNGF